jgi:hypothetical protein
MHTASHNCTTWQDPGFRTGTSADVHSMIGTFTPPCRKFAACHAPVQHTWLMSGYTTPQPQQLVEKLCNLQKSDASCMYACCGLQSQAPDVPTLTSTRELSSCVLNFSIPSSASSWLISCRTDQATSNMIFPGHNRAWYYLACMLVSQLPPSNCCNFSRASLDVLAGRTCSC